MEDDGSCWSKLTVNIPSVPLTDNEIILNKHNDNKTKSIVDKLIETKVIAYTNQTVSSGFNTYKIVNIDFNKLKTVGPF